MVLGHAERSTTRAACLQLASNWKEQVLQALAHRKWMDHCDAERAAGRDDPQTAARAMQEAERRQLQAEADSAAADRAQENLPARISRERRSREPRNQSERGSNTVWDRMPESVRRDARFTDTIPSNERVAGNATRSNDAAGTSRSHQSERRTPNPRSHHMRQTALDGSNPQPSRRERERQRGVRHGRGRPDRRDTH